MPESRFYHITPEGKFLQTGTLAEVSTARRQGGFIWLDYFEPSKEEIISLVEPFELHPLSVEDCFDENQIPKIDDFPNYTFILFNTFTYSREELVIREADIFIGTDYLITINCLGPNNQQQIKNFERILELGQKSGRYGSAFLMHVVMDYIVDQKFFATEAIDDELDKAEETILSDLTEFKPSTLLHLRRDLLALRKCLFHEREILVKICRKDCPFVPENALYLYRDIYDHLNKYFELTETSREIVTSLMEIYLSMLNNRMAQTANQTNRTVRRLTFITTIFMPLSLLAGIGGMSEWSMMTKPENWRISYPVFLLAMVILGIINYYLLKRLEKHDKQVE
jgi:magnesium transporter